MATVTFDSQPFRTVGELPATGQPAPAFELVGSDLGAVTLDQFAGKRVVLNVFPSLDTPVCATSVRTFNRLAAGLDNTVVLSVSMDLPFAQGRFCTTEGIENVVPASAFRSSSAPTTASGSSMAHWPACWPGRWSWWMPRDR